MKVTVISNKTAKECKQFYASDEWQDIRKTVIDTHKLKCICCAVNLQNTPNLVNVDHILPLKYYWDQRADPDNLQILCKDCNKAKGNCYRPDWQFIVLQKRYNLYLEDQSMEKQLELNSLLQQLAAKLRSEKQNEFYQLKKQKRIPTKTKNGFYYSLNTWLDSQALQILWQYHINNN